MNSSEIGGPTSAFTRYAKPPEPVTQLIIITRTKRKSAFSRIKRLFSINSKDDVEPSNSSNKTTTSKGSNDSRTY